MNTPQAHRAADTLVSSIEKRILAGTMPDGSTLPAERDLMDEFEVSRTVVREAVQLLSSRGLIETRPRFRPKVRAPGYHTAFAALGSIATHMLARPGGVRNLFETRVFVEAGLVREAAKSADTNSLSAMRDALAQNKAAIEKTDLFHETDMAFHGLLYQVPRNPVMPALHQAYTSWLAPHWSQMPRQQERNQLNYESHKAIFDAILMRDPDAAEAALRAHLDNAWQQVRLTFTDIEEL